jgi:aspartate aminotransferase
MRFAKRVAEISASPTMAVMLEAQKLRNQGVDVIDLGPGEPDFPTGEAIRRCAAEAIQSGFTRYTPSIGIPELRQSVAERFNRKWGTAFTAENVAISCGAKHAIYNTCVCLFESGDRVLVPVPYWVTFPEVIRITGARAAFLETRDDEGFVLKQAVVEKALQTGATGLIINSPNNPTGAVIPGHELEAIAALCRQRGVFLLSDESYESFVYGDNPSVSLAAFCSPAEESFAVVGSVSKTFAMTGWRIGYCLAHADLIRKISDLQSHQTGNPASISQKAALAALTGGDASVVEMRNEYRSRRDLLVDQLKTVPGFRCGLPEGAFYLFPCIREALRLTSLHNSEEFSRFLLQEARVATVPGTAFGLDGYIRLSYATSAVNLREALSRIRTAMSRFAGN